MTKGNRKKLTAKQRAAKAQRNERRGRDSKLAAWEKDHVVKPKEGLRVTGLKSKKTLAERAFMDELAKLPAVEDTRRHNVQ